MKFEIEDCVDERGAGGIKQLRHVPTGEVAEYHGSCTREMAASGLRLRVEYDELMAEYRRLLAAEEGKSEPDQDTLATIRELIIMTERVYDATRPH
jgi:hypothetical protein